MKSLSIEEKAKAYDEAIEAAQRFYNNSVAITKKGLEDIFPELKESEDERIVKELLTFFRECVHGGHILTNKEYDSWIAWLEKQGEQKPADNIESSAFKDKLLELFQKFRYTKEGVITNGDIIDYVDAHIQELIGTIQKPAETEKGAKGNEREIPISVWSEEDKQMSNIITSDVLRIRQKCGIGTDEWYIRSKALNWLRNLKDRVQPQPKQEWSEEVQEKQVSEEFINALGTMLNDGLPDRYLVSEERIKKSAELLFSIARKQLKNEMQEWSEEDKEILDDIIVDVEVLKEQDRTKDGKAAYQKEIDWLKSLKDKYTWKPSDEQMDAIDYVKNFDYGGYKDMLVSLYYDLKKLKDE